MGDKLKPGGMGNRDCEGDPPQFRNSMAAAIEEALVDLVYHERGLRLPTNDNSPETRDRRMLFVAIAQGIVEHLQINQKAFEITSTTGTLPDAEIEIHSE